MLIELRVTELGIVSDLTLVPGAHLNTITGETGAGKTLLIEALELLLGARADPGLVRDGATKARVEGRFVDPDSGEEIVLARVVPGDGRSRAYVDGHMATAGELAAVGARLVDLHGQHAHQTLLAPAVQRSALDRFAGTPALDDLRRYREARDAERDLQAELDGLGGDDRARARELDLLRFQINEIEAATLADDAEDVTLEAEETLLADVVAHREALAAAFDAVEGPALDAIGGASTALANRRPFHELAERLRAVQAELADLGSALRLGARVAARRSRARRRGPDPAPAAPRTHAQVRRDARRGASLRRRGRPAPGELRATRPTPPRSRRPSRSGPGTEPPPPAPSHGPASRPPTGSPRR